MTAGTRIRDPKLMISGRNIPVEHGVTRRERAPGRTVQRNLPNFQPPRWTRAPLDAVDQDSACPRRRRGWSDCKGRPNGGGWEVRHGVTGFNDNSGNDGMAQEDRWDDGGQLTVTHEG